MKPSTAGALLLPLALLAGCQGTGVAGKKRVLPPAEHPQEAAGPVLAKRAAGSAQSGIRLVSDEEPGSLSINESAVAPIAPIAPLSLNLDRAIETGFNQNPDLVLLRQTEGVSIGQLGVAQTYPFNPWIQVRATPIQHQTDPSAGKTVYNYVLAQQQIQLAHQQQFREEVAGHALNQVRWNIHQAELMTLAQTERLFFTALYQRGIRDLLRTNAELNEQLLAISERQLQLDVATPADVAIVRLDSRSTKQQAELAEAQYQAALLDLRRQLNLPLETPLDVEGDLTRYGWTPVKNAANTQLLSSGQDLQLASFDDREVVRRLAAGRPDVMAARTNMAVGYSNYKLANASRVPDLQIGPYYQRTESGTYYYGFNAQMDIPVINNGMPLVHQRVAEQRQQQVAWQQLQARAEVEAVNAVDRYERARRIVEAARPELSEELPAELQRLEAQFQEGEVDVLRIFQARTSLITNRRAFLDTLNELAQAAANVTQTTGLPPLATPPAGG